MRPGLRLHIRHLVIIALTLVTWSCSDDSTSLIDPTDDTPPPLGANPDGILLAGDAAAPAVDAIHTMPPSAVEPDDVGEDGFLTIRLSAVLAPGATVESVNQALEAADARIVAMRAGLPFVSLVVPPMTDAADARTRAAALAASDAFAFVFPAHAPVPPNLDTDGALRVTDAQIDPAPDHLLEMRLPAAWTARRLAETTNQKVIALVPDIYLEVTPHDDIPSQTFVNGAGVASTPATTGMHAGNHGFHVSGILGADPESDHYSGVHPVPGTLLDIRSIPLSGLSWEEKLMEIADHWPPAGNVVINTSLGYNDAQFTRYSKVQRALDGALWRILVSDINGRLVHASSAGNTGDATGDGALARYGSPFRVSAGFPDIQALADEDTSATPEQLLELGLLLAAYPAASIPPGNVLMVGSSNLAGEELNDSCAGSDVRAVGRAVPGPCVEVDPSYAGDPEECDGTVAYYWGTSMASPQVAGLAAYLWNLSPTRTPVEIRQILHHAYVTSPVAGILDAYQAVLALDPSMADPRVRMTILDVAGESATPGQNGKFDHHDLKLFLDQHDLHADDNDPGYSRYDLDGDGWIGVNVAGERFDLDVNDPPQYGTVTAFIEGETASFDESNLGDIDILCYYAYSSLYTGDEDLRRTFLTDHAPQDSYLVGQIEANYVLYEGYPSEVRVRAGYVPVTGRAAAGGGDADWAAGIDVTLTLDGGSASPSSGETDADGYFTFSITPHEGTSQVALTAHISDGLGQDGDLEQDLSVTPVRIDILNGSIGAIVDVESRMRTSSGSFSHMLIDDTDQEHADLLDGETASVSATSTRSGSYEYTSGRTMNANTSANASGSNTMGTSGGGATMTIQGTVAVSATIEGEPEDNFWTWYTQSCGDITAQRYFEVVGLPATCSVSMTAPSQGNVSLVALGRDAPTFICWSSDFGHCDSGSGGEWTKDEDGNDVWTGLLQPGFRYSLILRINHFNSGMCAAVGSGAGIPDAGTVSHSDTGSVSITVTSLPPGS